MTIHNLALRPAPTLPRVTSDKEIASLIAEDRIATMSIRLPAPCNLDCVYCYGTPKSYKELRMQGTHLTYEEIVSVLDQGIALGCRSVSFVGDGDPFLYRDQSRSLLDIVGHLTSKGVNSIVFTNALGITDRLANELVQLDVVLVAKQNSLDPDQENELMGKRWASERLDVAINRLKGVGFNATSPSRLAMHTVICKQNLAQLPRMWRAWRADNIIPYVQVWVPPVDLAQQQRTLAKYSVEKEAVRSLFRSLLAIDEEEFGYTWDADWTYPIAGLGCSVVLTGVGLTPTGEVQLCAYTVGRVGNVSSQSLQEILSSDCVRQIRRHGYGVGGHTFHYGCRAIARNVTGNRFHVDPEHWMRAGVRDSDSR